MTARGGTRLDGRYLLGERIAIGGMGEVWRGRDEVLGRTVAVKILRAELAEDPSFRKRFYAEAKTAGSLPHNGIAAVFDYGETTVGPDGVSPSPVPVQGDGIAYLVMELVPGEPLSAILQRDGALGTERTLAIVAQAAHALHAAHIRGVVHRDVKPANLMVTPEGRVKVTDFGIARPTDHEPLTMTGQVMGTAHYLAPELARGLDASALSDVYALGVVAYECLAGHRPFEGENQVLVATAHLNQQPPPLPGTVPPEVIRVVGAAMEKEPEARIPSAEVLADALDKLAAHDPSALDDIGGSGAGARAAQAPTFGPGGGVLAGGAAAASPAGRHSAKGQTGPGSDSTTRLTGSPPEARPRWSSPHTAPQGHPTVQGSALADGTSGSPNGPGRFGPGDSSPGSGYSLSPAPSGRRRDLRSVMSPTLILMLSLLALIIVLIVVLDLTGNSGGLVDFGDDPSPAATQSVDLSSGAPTVSPTSGAVSVTGARSPTRSPSRPATSTRPPSTTTAPSAPKPTPTPTPTPSEPKPTPTPTPTPTPSVPTPSAATSLSPRPSSVLVIPSGAVLVWAPLRAWRRRKRETRGASGEGFDEAGSTMVRRNEQGWNA